MNKNANSPQKTNALAVIGIVSAFIVPLAGLVCSIIGLSMRSPTPAERTRNQYTSSLGQMTIL